MSMRAEPHTVARSLCPCIALAAALLLTAAPAQAQQPDPQARAQELFRQGRSFIEQRDYAQALPAFQESQRLSPKTGTLINVAQCEENLGKVVRAWQHYNEAEAQLPPEDPRRPIVEAYKAAVIRRLPWLRITLPVTAQADLRVQVDDVDVPPEDIGFERPVEPGRHQITVITARGAMRLYSVTMLEGKHEQMSIQPP